MHPHRWQRQTIVDAVTSGFMKAHVTSVRAVLGSPEQRCWVEPEQVVQNRGGPNVPAAIAGAAVGANIGRNGTAQAPAQNVQRCENMPSQAQPQYWDVAYNFRGQEHRIQMTSPPGATMTVNEQGEPRR